MGTIMDCLPYYMHMISFCVDTVVHSRITDTQRWVTVLRVLAVIKYHLNPLSHEVVAVNL